VSMGTRRSVLSLWVTLVFAGSLLALIAREAGPLPGDLTLTRLLQEWLPPDGLGGSLLGYAGRIMWFVPVAFIAVALLRRRWLPALIVLVGAVTGLVLGDALKFLVARSRPSAELVLVYEPSEGHGFPSTTALLAVVLLGTVCYLVWRERPRRPSWPSWSAFLYCRCWRAASRAFTSGSIGRRTSWAAGSSEAPGCLS
jgi:hypothetical protein